MTIHIKDQYQPQREMTVAQVNLELQHGTISTQAMAWKPGLQDWVPVLSLPDIQAPVPPLLPVDMPSPPQVIQKPEHQSTAQTESSVTTSKWTVWGILASIGIALAYVILISTVFSAGLHPGKNEYGPLWAGICSIALFRRMLRMRSQAVILTKPQFKALSHYFLSYWSAFWRWLLVFIGIITLGCFSVETAGDAGGFFGSSIAFMTIGMFFAIDIPSHPSKTGN